MKSIAIAIIALYFSALQGCATLNESECAEANWQDIGFSDGAIGERTQQLSRHQKACGKHGIAVDVDSYNTGRDNGLKTFCTAETGYKEGIDGDEYFDVCPKPLASVFTAAYVKGLKIKQEQLSIEQERIDRELTISRLERAALASSGPNKSLDDNIDSLQSRGQSLLNDRLEIQRWISKWSGP